jgi:hypothetical protein
MKLDLVVTSFMLATTIVRVFLFKSFMTKAKTDMAAELLSSLGKDHIGPTGLESRKCKRIIDLEIMRSHGGMCGIGRGQT